MRRELKSIVLAIVLTVFSGCSSFERIGTLDLCGKLDEQIDCVGTITGFSEDTIKQVGGKIYDTTSITVIEPNVSKTSITVLSEGLPEDSIFRDVGGTYSFKIRAIFLVNRDDCRETLLHSFYLAFPEDIEFEQTN